MTRPTTERRFAERSASFIGSAALAGRVLERLAALGQILVVAAVLGSSTRADLYFIASIVPLVIGGVAGEALFVSILPLAQRRRQEADAIFAAGFWLAAGVLAAVTIAYLGGVMVVVPAAEPAGTGSPLAWIAFAPIGLLLGLGTFCAAPLTYYERYLGPPLRGAVATHVGLALTGVVFLLGGGVVWIGLAVSAGFAVACLLLIAQLLAIGRGAVFRLPSRSALSTVLTQWRRFGASVVSGLVGGQLFVMLERALAAPLGVGSAASISYARGLAFAPTIAAQAIAFGLYPGMMRASAEGAVEYLRARFRAGLRLTLFLAVSAGGVLAVFAAPITLTLFEWGSLSPKSLMDVERSLIAFALGLVAMMLGTLTSRTYTALQTFRWLVVQQAAALAAYVLLGPLLAHAWGTPGLALGFSLAEVVGAVLGLAFVAVSVGERPSLLLRTAVTPALGRGCLVIIGLGTTRVVLETAGVPSAVSVLIGIAVGGALVAGILLAVDWAELESVKRVLLRRRSSNVRDGLGDEGVSAPERVEESTGGRDESASSISS